MAGKLGNLTIDIAADVAHLRRDMAKAQHTVTSATDKMARSARTAGRALGLIAGTVVTGAAIASLKRLVDEQRAVIDSQAKFADVIGLTTEQFAGFQLGAQISGVELAQLDTGLQRFLKNVGDAGDGLQAPIRSLEKLGLSFADLKDLTTDEQLKLVADRFKDLDSSVDKASVSLGLFGRAGLNISKLLETGAEGINRFQGEADALGLTIDRIDAAKIESANDAMTRAGLASQAFGKNLTVEVAPVLESIGLEFVELAKQTGGFKGAAEDIAGALETVVDFTRDAVFVARLMVSEYKLFADIAPQLGASIIASLNPFDGISSAKAQADFRTEFNKLRKVQEEELQKLVDSSLAAREKAAFALGNTPLTGGNDSGNDDSADLKALTSKLDAKAAAIFAATRTAAEKYELQYRELAQLLNTEKIDKDTFNRALQGNAEDLAAATAPTERFDYETALEQKAYEERYLLAQEHTQRLAEQEEIRKQNTASTLATISTLASTENKKLAAIGKAAAIVQATQSGIVAVQKAYELGPIAGPIAAAATALAVGANIARLGGSFNADAGGGGGDYISAQPSRIDNVVPLYGSSQSAGGGGYGAVNWTIQLYGDRAADVDVDENEKVISIVLSDYQNGGRLAEQTERLYSLQRQGNR